jgi:ATP-dependent protease ClpP protease subunit
MKGVIKIEGEIGTDVTLESVRAQIDPKATEYEIQINSGGGEVFTGEDIYNELKSLKKPKTVIITGLCASIATLIAGAGDRRKMYEVGHYMIHNPSVGIEGDANDLRKGADTLDHIKKVLISVYEKFTRKAGILRDQLWKLLDDETWYTPEEALKMGFIDEIIRDIPEAQNKRSELKFMASIDTKRFKMKDKEKNEGAIEKLSNMVTIMMKHLRGAKNMVNDTLSDGTAIIVQSEGDDWTNAQVTFEDGSPLPAGEYTTASGVKFMVDENSTITTVAAPEEKEPEEEAEKQSEEEMKKVEELNAQIAELKKQLEAKNTESAAKEKELTATNENVKKFEGLLKSVQEDLQRIKNTTAGDKSKPDADAHDKKVDEDDEPVAFDPMANSWGAAAVSRIKSSMN